MDLFLSAIQEFLAFNCVSSIVFLKQESQQVAPSVGKIFSPFLVRVSIEIKFRLIEDGV